MELFSNHNRDLQSCTSMGVSSNGQLALFAGRRVYGLINLDHPNTLLCRENRQSKWDVITCSWSHIEEQRAAVASNNKVELLNITGSEIIQDFFLRAHTRVITDMAWHTHNKNIIATSATDAFIYLWDLRDARRPANAFQAVAGATKVKWNTVSGKYLASSHEGEVKLWDFRTSKSPVQYINAHFSRIYDMDWSHDDENHLVTTSQDGSVKFWNIANPSKSENIIKVQQTPVWQVRYTPFGNAVITLAVQSVVRGENRLMLWNNSGLLAPVHTFYAPDMILDMAWRQWPDTNKCHLVTWSKDLTLRIWNIDLELQEKCGLVVDEEEADKCEEPEPETTDDINNDIFSPETNESSSFLAVDQSPLDDDQDDDLLSASPSHYSQSLFRPNSHYYPDVRSLDFRAPAVASSYSAGSGFDRAKPMNLNYEFSLINYSDKLRVETQDAMERLFTVCASTNKNELVLNVKFPPNYPNQTAPTFSFLEGTTIDNLSRNNILQKLRSVAKQHSSRNRRCLEPCLRQFEQCVDNLSQQEEEQLQVNNPQLTAGTKDLYGGEFPDHNVPFPRSSGARFCGNGHLVCFGVTRRYTVMVATPTTPVDGLHMKSEEEEISTRRQQNSRRTGGSISSSGGDSGLGGGSSSSVSSSSAAAAAVAAAASEKKTKTPRALSALSMLGSNGSTSPNYGLLPMFGQHQAQDFTFKTRLSRVRFTTQKSRALSTSSDEPPVVLAPGGAGGLEPARANPSFSNSRKRQAEAKVTVYDCTALMPYSKQLGEMYIVPSSPEASSLGVQEICRYNAQVAFMCDKPDLHQLWTLLAVVASPNTGRDTLNPWSAHPCGRSLLTSVLSHYISAFDVQTVAIICCIFGNKVENAPRFRKKNSKSESSQLDKGAACDALAYSGLGKHNRSNSDTQNEEILSSGYSKKNSLVEADLEEDEKYLDGCGLLDPKQNKLYDSIIQAYSEILFRWKLLQRRTEVMKEVSEAHQYESYVAAMSVSCRVCSRLVRGSRCTYCREHVVKCAVCRISCRGIVSLCGTCGHGGHTVHLRDWFSAHEKCPSGCGCRCLQRWQR